MTDSLDHFFSGIEADKLPSLPHVLLVLLDAAHTEVISFDELSDVITKDSALTNRIITASSAAYFGGQGKDMAFERMLVLLGLDTIKTISITASVQQFFSRFDTKNTQMLKCFWRDSLMCALTAKALAKLTGYELNDEAYIAGLMHNMGELIFAHNFPDQYEQIAVTADSLDEMLVMEVEHFGGNRFEAAAWLISGWDIETFISDALLFQNEPLEQIQDAHHLVKIIYLANRLCSFHGEIDDDALNVAEQLFDLDREFIMDLVKDVRLEVSEAAKSMGIVIIDEETDESEEAEIHGQDEDIQVELADRVRTIALMDGVRQTLARTEGEQAVFHAIQQGLHILFAVRNSLFFLAEPLEGRLVGKSVTRTDSRNEEISLPLGSDNSVLTRCLTEKTPISTFDETEGKIVSVVDRQVIKLSGNEGLMCLPLVSQGYQVGVLAIGYNEMQKQRLESQQLLLMMFANEAAYQILSEQKSSQEESEKSEEERKYYYSRARELVHEANNPLSIIKNYVHILGSKLEEDDNLQHDLVIIKEELERAGSILLRLPGIADKQTTESGADLVNINNLISDLLKVFRSSLFATRNIEAISDFDEDMTTIVCSRNALKQIVTNLLKNAAEASSDSGRITVTTQAMVNHNGKQYVEIVISDDGPGIPVEVQKKLFNPVESTKGQNHSGLGLSIVKNLVDGMGGAISCRSNAKSGTRFELLIPRVLE